ncbi:MAG: pentapeptide repeat-containing protein [Jatrophihabitans sp.]
MARTRRIMPQRPNIAAELEGAPPTLAHRESWDGRHAGPGLRVDGTVADAELIGSRFTGIDFTSRTLTGLRARDVVFDTCDLSGAVLDGAAFDRVVFTGCRLTGTMLTATRLRDVIIEDSTANLGNFRAAQADYLFIERTVLTESDFYTARLRDSAILDCDLTGANVTDLHPERLSLHGSTLDGLVGVTALAGSRIDADQVIPLGAALVAGLGIRAGGRPR